MQLVQAKHSLIECIRNVSLITSREALDLARDSRGDEQTSVHKIRVATKKLRATWYLLRAGITRTPSEQAITRLRSTARQLAAARDKTVVREVLADLSASPLGIAETLPETELHGARLIELLQMEQETWLEFEPELFDKELLIKNLRRTYRRAKKLGIQAIRKSSDYEQRHQWRKWVKYLYYQLDLFEQCGLTGQTKFIDYLDELGEALGNEHDLYVLKERIVAHKDDTTSSVIKELKRDLKKSRLQTKKLHNKIFVSGPDRFMRRLRKKDPLFFFEP